VPSESLQGRLLIASPSLVDPNFRRTVVLITVHGDEGAMGIVLNRPAPAAVAEAVPHLEHLVAEGDAVFVGGPVQPEAVTALAEVEDTEALALPVFDAVGFLPAELDAEAGATTRRARVFAGYAGWGDGQLEAELGEAAWIVEPARPDDVFSERPEELWADVLRRKGGEFRLLATMPEDPSLN
jgi:putative transcriptional regulator